MTDPLGQSQVLPYLKGLTKHGYEFHLISFEKFERFNEHKKHIYEICDEAGIHWHPQDYNTQGGLLKTIKQVRKMKKVVSYLYSKHKFEAVHCRSYISALVGLSLKRKYNLKFIFDMRGFWADERVDGKIWDLKSPIYNKIYHYFKKKELDFINESDYTVSLTEKGKSEIFSWNKINKSTKIKVIPCCVDLVLFDKNKVAPKTLDKVRTDLDIKENQFVLGYVGSIGTWYLLPEMLDYFKELKNTHPNALFLFITADDSTNIIQEAALKGINKESIKTVSVLHKEVPAYIALFDASIFFIKAAYSKKASSPTKQGEIMAMGIPLICNSGIGDTDEIVYKYNSGKVITELNSNTYKDHIIQPEKFDAIKISEGAASYFSLEEGVNRYLSIYKELNV